MQYHIIQKIFSLFDLLDLHSHRLKRNGKEKIGCLGKGRSRPVSCVILSSPYCLHTNLFPTDQTCNTKYEEIQSRCTSSRRIRNRSLTGKDHMSRTFAPNIINMKAIARFSWQRPRRPPRQASYRYGTWLILSPTWPIAIQKSPRIFHGSSLKCSLCIT